MAESSLTRQVPPSPTTRAPISKEIIPVRTVEIEESCTSSCPISPQTSTPILAYTSGTVPYLSISFKEDWEIISRNSGHVVTPRCEGNISGLSPENFSAKHLLSFSVDEQSMQQAYQPNVNSDGFMEQPVVAPTILYHAIHVMPLFSEQQ